jgi:hypothetical protein
MEESSFQIIKFRQAGKSDRECYLPWLNSVYDFVGSKTRTSPDYGLLGFIMNDEDFLNLSNAPFAPIAHPGNIPAVAGQVSYKIRLDKFNWQQEDFRDIKENILTSLPSDLKEPMMEPAPRRMLGRTAQWIMQFMADEFGTLSPQELSEFKNRLQTSYNPAVETFAAHRAKHVETHNATTQNGQPMTQSDKVDYYRKSLLECGLFTDAIAAYTRQHPRVVDQTFENFSRAMKVEEDSRDRRATTGNHGYAAATTHKPVTQADVELWVQSAIAAALKASPPNLQSANPTQGKQRAGRTNRNYCWSHGSCKHSSRDCRSKNPGHQDTATYKNQMGGVPA